MLLVTETPPGPYIAQDLWSGVLAFTVAGDGAPLVPVAGIDKSLLADPACVAFRAASSEVFVGNRHGVNAADGVSGSISRFIYNKAIGTLTTNGTIIGNSLSAVDQIAFNPLTGEMFVADFNYPTSGPSISRFTFDTAGNAIANGTLGNGETGGVAVAPDGMRLYATSGGQTSSVIRQFDLSNGGAALADVTIADAPRLFNMAVRNNVLYVAAVDVNRVYRLTIGAADDLTLKDSIAADGAVSVAFSPDRNEMFTAAHLTSEFIDRFSLNAADDAWTSTTKVMTTSSLGGILVLQ
jgi:6-phosphogluconolactonase (cycloisomerase 2 family)